MKEINMEQFKVLMLESTPDEAVALTEELRGGPGSGRKCEYCGKATNYSTCSESCTHALNAAMSKGYDKDGKQTFASPQDMREKLNGGKYFSAPSDKKRSDDPADEKRGGPGSGRHPGDGKNENARTPEEHLKASDDHMRLAKASLAAGYLSKAKDHFDAATAHTHAAIIETQTSHENAAAASKKAFERSNEPADEKRGGPGSGRRPGDAIAFNHTAIAAAHDKKAEELHKEGFKGAAGTHELAAAAHRVAANDALLGGSKTYENSKDAAAEASDYAFGRTADAYIAGKDRASEPADEKRGGPGSGRHQGEQSAFHDSMEAKHLSVGRLLTKVNPEASQAHLAAAKAHGEAAKANESKEATTASIKAAEATQAANRLTQGRVKA